MPGALFTCPVKVTEEQDFLIKLAIVVSLVGLCSIIIILQIISCLE